MAKKVVLDSGECVACETCIELCPDVFALDEGTGKAHVVKETGGPEECIDEAIDSCPVSCISWE